MRGKQYEVSLAVPKINRFWKTYVAGVATTIIIELIQLAFHRGIFELDDIMNNFLGTMIGYGILRFIVNLFFKKEKQVAGWKKIVLLQIPLFVTVGFFLIISISYNQMELGTLSSHYIQKGMYNQYMFLIMRTRRMELSFQH